MKHQDLTAPHAIHPFAFVSATDPALDPDNEVATGKAWIDTSAGNALKIRNSIAGWDTVAAGTGQVSVGMVLLTAVEALLTNFGESNNTANDWTLFTHI